MLEFLPRIRSCRAGRQSSWNTTGANMDYWMIEPGESRVLADIDGPGRLTHIWMTQRSNYRECLLKITYDDAARPSVLCPLGDFFGLGSGIVTSYQSLLFSASTRTPYQFNQGCALNCYAPMPFRRRCRVELVNESDEPHKQYFYIDYEKLDRLPEDFGYFHAEFRRQNPFGGWGHELREDTDISKLVPNKGREAWRDNYVILETRGHGHYLGCNLSVTNFHGGWWGEGDDMIWVDGYKWPPDLHGTGSEDYFGQAWGMQENAFLRNGSSVFAGGALRGYQTSYVFHLENPVHFTREIKVTIEGGHANHLANEMSSVAYWYAEKPTAAIRVPPVAQRLPVLRDNQGNWLMDPKRQTRSAKVPLTPAKRRAKAKFRKQVGKKK